jgi:hypothetical protein
MPTIKHISRTQLEKRIAGALKDCINQHGPITSELTGSAAKRVGGLLKQEGLFSDEAVVE